MITRSAMKKSYYLPIVYGLLFISIFISAYSQTDVNRKPNNKYLSSEKKLKTKTTMNISKYGLDDDIRITYSYNHLGDTISVVTEECYYQQKGIYNWKYRDKSWAGIDKVSYTYDGNSLVEKLFYDYEDYQTLAFKKQLLYFYNKMMWVDKVKQYEYDKNLVLYLSAISYISYNDNGDTTEIKTDEYYFDDSVNVYSSSRIYCEYNEHGLKTLEKYDNKYFDGWFEKTRAEYTYDNRNNLTRMEYSEFSEPQLMETYTYEDNKVIESSFYIWNSYKKAWELSEKVVYTYDIDGKLDKEKNSKYDISNNELVSDNNTEYSYDENGNMIQKLITRIYYKLLEKQDRKFTYEYDNRNRMVGFSEYQYNNTYDVWDIEDGATWQFNSLGLIKEYNYLYKRVSELGNNDKNFYEYDPNDRLAYQEEYSWNGYIWEINKETDYTYNENGLLKLELYYTYERGRKSLPYKTEYLYNNSGNLIERKNYRTEDDAWMERIINSYEYDENGFIVLEKHKNIDFNNHYRYDYFNNSFGLPDSIYISKFEDEWINSSKHIFNYDEKQREISKTIVIFDSETSIYNKHSRYEYFYNDKDMYDSLQYFQFSNEWNLKVKLDYFYEYDINGRLFVERSKIFGSDKDFERIIYEYLEPTDVREISNGTNVISISPNPATDYIFIRINDSEGKNAQIKVFDIYGDCVLSKEFNANSSEMLLTIPTEGLSSGIYTCSFISESKTASVKVVVIK